MLGRQSFIVFAIRNLVAKTSSMPLCTAFANDALVSGLFYLLFACSVGERTRRLETLASPLKSKHRIYDLLQIASRLLLLDFLVGTIIHLVFGRIELVKHLSSK